MAEHLSEFLQKVRKFDFLGTKRIEDRAWLHGHVPYVAPRAYLIRIYDGLSEGQLTDFESSLPLPIPPSYRAMLALFNGLSLFHRLSLYGYRESIARTGDAAYQPFDLIALNTYQCPEKPPHPNRFYIGGYSDNDRSHVFIDTKTEMVGRCLHERPAKVFNWWSDLWSFLNSEAERFSKYFLTDGTLADPKHLMQPPILALPMPDSD